jgi:hypothetical protein
MPLWGSVITDGNQEAELYLFQFSVSYKLNYLKEIVLKTISTPLLGNLG